MKRFCVPSSSHFTDDRVFNPSMAAAAVAFSSTVPPFTAQQMDSEVSPGASFSVSSTAMEDGENVGNFLERCFLCKKMLNQKNEVYMYGQIWDFLQHIIEGLLAPLGTIYFFKYFRYL